MNQDEITNLKETVAKESKEKIDPLEGEALALLGETEGWRILMRKANKKIIELLEPIPHEEVVAVKDLTLIGSMAIARSEKIEVLRWIIKQVETEKNARREMLAKKEEESKSKTQG